MSLENTLERIADALEALVKQGEGTVIVEPGQVYLGGSETVIPEETVTETPPATRKKGKKKTSKKKTGKAAKPEATATPTPPNMDFMEPATPVATPAMTLEQLTGEIGALARQLGPRAAEIGNWLNNQYQVERISDLDASYYDQFLAECRSMIPEQAS